MCKTFVELSRVSCNQDGIPFSFLCMETSLIHEVLHLRRQATVHFIHRQHCGEYFNHLFKGTIFTDH